MTDNDERPILSSAAEILEAGVNLERIQFLRLEAAVNEDVESLAAVPDEVSPSYGLKIRQEGREIGTRMSVTLDLISWKVVVDAAADYTLDVDARFADGALLDFANNVGIMALIPYLRQAIADLSQRVTGEVVLMPIIPRGGLVFTRDDAKD